MGLCEMIYHETRRFPPEEKEGLGRELRSSAIRFLKAITIESVKPQKEFLKALDDTTPLQLDILLLLKLAFRMGYIDQRAYQTLEEDLKGLESIIYNMKGMHGLHPPAPPQQKPIQDKTTPGPVMGSKEHQEKVMSEHQKAEKSVTEAPRDKPGRAPMPPPPDRRSRHPRPKIHHEKQPLSQRPMDKKPVPHISPKSSAQESKPVPPKSEPPSGSKIPTKDFEGTPLYEDDKAQASSSSSVKTEKKPGGEKSETGQSKANEPKPKYDDTRGKQKSKGLWSLRRTTPKKSPFEDPPSKKDDDRSEGK